MTDEQRYDMWLGSELGLVKGVTLANDTFMNYGDIKTLDKSLSITAMNWQEEKKNVHVGLKNGTVRTFDTQTYEYTNSLTCTEHSAVRGIIALSDGSLVFCSEKGKLKHVKNDEISIDREVGDDIKCMVGSSTDGIFATGGKENDLKVWQLDAMDKPLFSAKNVRHDFLDLRVPVWVSAIDFFQQDNKKLVIGTGHHSVRVYDRRDKRRPVLDTDWLEHPLTAVSMTPNNNSVIVGNTAGYMAEIDLRSGKQVGGFKGNCGSIRSIKCHHTQSYVAVCGLDRFLKIYDIKSREMIKKIYMKSNLNCLTMTNENLRLTPQEAGTKRDHETSTADDDKLWESMEAVSDKTKTKKETASKKKKLK